MDIRTTSFKFPFLHFFPSKFKFPPLRLKFYVISGCHLVGVMKLCTVSFALMQRSKIKLVNCRYIIQEHWMNIPYLSEMWKRLPNIQMRSIMFSHQRGETFPICTSMNFWATTHGKGGSLEFFYKWIHLPDIKKESSSVTHESRCCYGVATFFICKITPRHSTAARWLVARERSIWVDVNEAGHWLLGVGYSPIERVGLS